MYNPISSMPVTRGKTHLFSGGGCVCVSIGVWFMALMGKDITTGWSEFWTSFVTYFLFYDMDKGNFFYIGRIKVD